MAADLNLLYVREESKKGFIPGWLNPVGFCAFLLLTSIAAASFDYYALRSLRVKKDTVQKELRAAREEKGRLEAKLAETRLLLAGRANTLDFMLGDIRAAEILSELAICAESIAAIEKLEISVKRVTLYGSAENAGAISEFSEKLRLSTIFSVVGEPLVIQDANSHLTFVFQCDIRDILDLNEAEG